MQVTPTDRRQWFMRHAPSAASSRCKVVHDAIPHSRFTYSNWMSKYSKHDGAWKCMVSNASTAVHAEILTHRASC